MFKDINSTNGIALILGTRGINTHSCVGTIDKQNLKSYNYWSISKTTKKILIKEYVQNIVSSISTL